MKSFLSFCVSFFIVLLMTSLAMAQVSVVLPGPPTSADEVFLSLGALMTQGQSFLKAVSSAAVLVLIVQYGHRIYELFFEKKKDPLALP